MLNISKINNNKFINKILGDVSVLMFHRVLDNKEKIKIPGIEIHLNEFKKIIKHLNNKYQIISIEDIYNIEFNNYKKKIVISFDDGYIDNYLYVFPFLSELKIPFTIFICSDIINEKQFLWWYAINDNKELNLSTKQFKKLSYSDQQNYINTNLFHLHDKYLSFNNKYSMNWKQVKEISQSKYGNIGGHTKSHQALSKLDYNQSYYEISSNKKMIENQIGKKINSFAYPYGSKLDYSSREIRILEEIGYEYALTTVEGNIKHKQNKFQLPRIPINGNLNELDELDKRILGIHGILKQFR